MVSLPEGFHVQSNKPSDPSFIPTVLSVEPPAGVTVTEIVYPASTELEAGRRRSAARGVRARLHDWRPPGRRSRVPNGDLIVPARLRYQACDDTTCYIPTTADVQWTLRVVPARTPVASSHADVFGPIAFGHGEAPRSQSRRERAPATPAETRRPRPPSPELDDFTVLGTTGGYLGSEDFLTFIHNAETGVKERGLFEGRGPLAILLIVFLGGLALNLTPCVLPMIPINLAIIGAGAQAGSRSRGFLLGAAYGGAMALVYGVLGLVVILTAGTFGTINSSPWFNLGIAVLFVVLALAMFDVVTIDFSGLSSRFSPGSAGRGTFLLAFGMGAVAALLAGACVAPVVIQVVLFASNLYANGTAIALGLPFFLGAGMALPWPIAGAGLAALPKPGAWMVRVKQVFGVLILATAVYYGYEAYGLFANRWVDPAAVASSVQEKLKSGWHASLADGLERGEARAEAGAHRPLGHVVQELSDHGQDHARGSGGHGGARRLRENQVSGGGAGPAAWRKRVMQRFKAIGLPTYVILRSKDAARRRENAEPQRQEMPYDTVASFVALTVADAITCGEINVRRHGLGRHRRRCRLLDSFRKTDCHRARAVRQFDLHAGEAADSVR